MLESTTKRMKPVFLWIMLSIVHGSCATGWVVQRFGLGALEPATLHSPILLSQDTWLVTGTRVNGEPFRMKAFQDQTGSWRAILTSEEAPPIIALGSQESPRFAIEGDRIFFEPAKAEESRQVVWESESTPGWRLVVGNVLFFPAITVDLLTFPFWYFDLVSEKNSARLLRGDP